MRKLIRRLILLILIIALIGSAILIEMGYLDYKQQVSENSIDSVVEQLRTRDNYVKLNEMSSYMPLAIVAIEDKRYYQHGAIDVIGTTRAVVVNLVSKKLVQGGSTITQQLAKNLYSLNTKNGIKKISEAFLAVALEKKYSKKEILEMYLNIIYYGDQHYGIAQAAKGYFNMTPAQLDLARCALLAGLPQAPSIYALSNHDERTYQRQQQVLKAMLDQQLITAIDYNQALNEQLQ